jgi:hypothetical protein
LALQNNLDIERGRFDPQVAHTQVEQARRFMTRAWGLRQAYLRRKPSRKPDT